MLIYEKMKDRYNGEQTDTVMEKPLTAATVKGPKGKKRNGVSAWPVTILDTPAQLPPLAARIDGLASQIARIIDGTVSMGVEMQLIILAFNLAAVAEQVAHMENNLEVPA